MSDYEMPDFGAELRKRFFKPANVLLIVVLVAVLVLVVMWLGNSRIASQDEVQRVAKEKYGVTVDGTVRKYRSGREVMEVTLTHADGSTTVQRCYQAPKLGLPWERKIVIKCAEPGEKTGFEELAR